MTEQSGKKKGAGCLVVLGGFVLIVVILVIIISNSSSPNKDTINASAFIAGDNAIINDNTYVGYGESDKNYKEMINYFVAKNTSALNTMVGNGTALFEKKGTKVTVIDKGFAGSEIEIISTGERGWIPNEYITKQ